MLAIAHATTILGWYEHLSEEDMPPEWMWHLNDELEEHFEQVKERRRTGQDTDADADSTMIRNDYARGRGRQLAAADG
jgi:hypothetical protein